MSPRVASFRSSLLRLHEVIFKISDDRWSLSAEPKLSLLEEAVLILEDHRFFKHRGFDWISVFREVLKAITWKRFGGASTIDIQLFRTVSNRYERTFRRKLREIIGAYALQRKFSKTEILRAYLKCAYFGTELYGAMHASLSIYNKEPDDLSLEEALFIASLLVYPKPRVRNANWEAKVRRRADYGRLVFATRKKSLYEL